VRAAFGASATDTKDSNETGLPALAKELLAKLRRGQETWYLPALRYKVVEYFTTMPTLSLGGWIAAPAGPLASGLPAGEYLREADVLESEGNYLKVTRTWVGGPPGYWDADIYGAG
jgi:hypothetical protein